ncbi:MAG: domain S-box protein [Solirubrobacterales bacterium]|nr:domain S-box protein [Solirubrobacterales bacterium]
MPPADEERQLALLVSSAIDYAIFMLDPHGHVTTWNTGAERMKGYSRADIIGKHFSTFYTPEDRAREHPSEELRLALRDGHYEEEGWRVRKDGSRFWADIVLTALFDEEGTHVGFGKVSRDLTARREAEERARSRTRELESVNRQLDEFRRLVSSVRDYAIFMLDATGHILTWNAGAEQLKGYRPDDVIGRHFSLFYTAEDRARDHPAFELETAVREGRYEEEGCRVRKDGSTFWASVTITAVPDDDGRLRGFAKVTRDLTERKRSEDALRDAVTELRRANEDLERFASVAAHDMTDPLRTISGFAEMLLRADRSPELAREFAQHIYDSSVRLTGMLRGLLTYARAGAASQDAERVDVADVVQQTLGDLTALTDERSARITVDVPAGSQVQATADDLRNVLQNLVSNAIKFGDPERPTVTVTAEPAGAGSLRIAVTDNGSGVAESDRERIFNAFERSATAIGSSGYGLGLAICLRLVERHGGQIGVENAREGSTFWFTLPTPAQTQAPVAATPTEAAE